VLQLVVVVVVVVVVELWRLLLSLVALCLIVPVETMPSSPEVVHASVAGTVNGQLMLVTPQGMVIKCQVPGCAMAYRTQEELSFHERKRHADLLSAMETGELSPRFGSLKRGDANASDDSGTVVSDESSQRSDVVAAEEHAPPTAPPRCASVEQAETCAFVQSVLRERRDLHHGASVRVDDAAGHHRLLSTAHEV
jgi:hypothetical protein